MGEVLVVGHLKGGSGKTNTAMYLATGAAAAGKRVHLIDGDVNSQSAHDWSKVAKQAGQPLPFDVERFVYNDIDEHVESLRDQTDLVIIDSAGGNETFLEAAVSVADLLLVPMAPERSEARRAAATVTTASRGAARSSREVSMLVLLHRVVLSSTQRVVWRQQLEQDGYEVAATEIRRLVGYSDAYGSHPSSVGDYADLLAELELIEPQQQEATA